MLTGICILTPFSVYGQLAKHQSTTNGAPFAMCMTGFPTVHKIASYLQAVLACNSLESDSVAIVYPYSARQALEQPIG